MPEFIHPYHTNGMKFAALDENGNVLKDWLVFSVGGGTIKELTDSISTDGKSYPQTKIDDIIKWCKENNKEHRRNFKTKEN